MKKIILWMFVIVLLSSFVCAGYEPWTEADLQNYSFIDVGGISYDGSSFNYPSDGDSLSWSSVNNEVYDDDGQYLGNMSMITTDNGEDAYYSFGDGTDITISVEFYDDLDSSLEWVLKGYYSGTGGDFGSIGINTGEDANNYVVYRPGEGWKHDTLVNRTLGWHNFSLYADGSSIQGYIDQVKIYGGSRTKSLGTIGIYTTDTDNKYFDNAKAWEGDFADEHQPTGGGGTDPVGSLNVTLLKPIDRNFTNFVNFDAYYNVTSTNSSIVNCTTYLDNVSQWIESGDGQNNSRFGVSNIALTEGEHSWDVRCYDEGGNYANSSVYTIIRDSTNPSFILNIADGTDIVGDFYFEVNVTELYPKNITIDADCGFVYNNISMEGTGFNYSYNLSVGNCTIGEKLLNITIYDNATNSISEGINWNNKGRINITATAAIDGGSIQNFTIYVNGTLNGSTNNSNYYLDGVTTNTYEIMIYADGYAYTYTNVTPSSAYTAVNFDYVYSHNSINISFYDEVYYLLSDDALINVEFISDGGANYTHNTDNGTLYVDLLSPESYVIRYSANQSYGGRNRHYYFTLTNRTHNVLELFLISNPDKNITATVYDATTLDKREGAMVYVQRRFTDNIYRTVSMYETDVSGLSYFEVDSDEYYKVKVDFPWKTQKYLSNTFYFESNAINLYIQTQEDIAQDYYDEDDIIYSLAYVNASNEFQVTYTDNSGIATEYCLYLQTHQQYGNGRINSTCTTTASSTLLVGGMHENKTYYGVFAATINGEERVLSTAWKEFVNTQLDAGTFGVFMALVLVITFAFLSAIHILAMILASAGLVFAKLIGLITIGWNPIFAVIIVSIIIGVVIEVKK